MSIGESRWFVGTVFVVSGFMAGVLLACIIYFGRIKNAGGCGNVSKGEAQAMYVICIILFIIFIFLFLWALLRLLLAPELKANLIAKATAAYEAQSAKAAAYLNQPVQGFLAPAQPGSTSPTIFYNNTPTPGQSVVTTTVPISTSPQVSVPVGTVVTGQTSYYPSPGPPPPNFAGPFTQFSPPGVNYQQPVYSGVNSYRPFVT